MNQNYYPINRIVKLFLAIIVSLCFQQISFAQSNSGVLQGSVKDSTTSEPLFGTTVWLEGTSQGIATDIDGEYRITQIEPGNYNVIYRYIGYEQKKVAITIKKGQTLNLNVKLVSKAIEGKEVVVTAQARGQKEAINQQLSANTIKNIVSSEKIRQLPDDNAATALSRLPGVSLMNGDQVVIRGVEAKLNQVMVNGIQLPSTGMNDRATSLGFISSNMLAGIEVVKAITPDMDANTIGGVVNLKLREAAPGLHSDVLAQGQYNKTDKTAGNYKVWASVSNRFFDDDFGVFVQANADRTDGGNQSARINPGISGSGSSKYGESVYQTNSASFEYDQDVSLNSGFSVILDYKLPNGKIIMQNTYAQTSADNRHHISTADFSGFARVFTMDRNKFGKDMWINAIQAENTFGDIKVEASLSHSFTDQYTRFAYQSGTWCDFQNLSKAQFPFGVDAAGKPVNYNSQLEQISLQRAYGIFDNFYRPDIDSTTLEGWVSSIANTFQQHLYNASADVTIPFNISKDITATFKVGGKFVRTTRENNFDRWFSGAGDDDTYANVQKYFSATDPSKWRTNAKRLKLTDVLDNNFERGSTFLADEYDFKNGFKYVINADIYDDWLRTSMQGWTNALKKDDSWKDDFSGDENFTAGYFMGTFNIFHNLTVLGGFRYEKYDMNYHANFTYILHSVYGDAVSTQAGTAKDIPYETNNVARTDENFFPNAQVRYKFNDWLDVRVAYTSGISRPDYSNIIPKIAYAPSDRNMELGNPYLKPAKAKNLDFIASVYSNEIGLFTVNAFFKKLEDVQRGITIYYANLAGFKGDVAIPDSAWLATRGYQTPSKNDRINTTYNNPNPGYIKGIEVDWQTHFWYLPGVLSSLVLDINYTKSWSEMDYRITRLLEKKVLDSRNRPVTVYQTLDTLYNARLLQQAGDVVNIALGVDYKGFSGRLSFNMRGDVINNIGVRPEESSYTGNIYRWDFTLKQSLPIEGLSVALNGINIFHNAINTYRYFRLNANAPITKNLVSVLYSPTLFQLNLRYSF